MNDRSVVKTRAWTATLVQRDRDDWKRYYSKTRIYDAPQAFASEAYQAYMDGLSDPKVGENAERWLRQDMIKKTRAALRDAMPQLVPYVSVNFRELNGTTFPNAETLRKGLSYSDKAGCSCGCSPGFIWKDGDSLRDRHGVAVDVWFSANKPEIDITPEVLRKAVDAGAMEVLSILEELDI